MPMHLCLASDGRILSAGPTIRKVARQPLIGEGFFAHFQLRRPGGIVDVPGLLAMAGETVRLGLIAPPATTFRGVALPLADPARLLVNLSFGIDLARAVQDHALTDSDFAPTDLAIELLYLIEAKTLVMAELQRLTGRLQSARIAAEEQAKTDTLTGLSNRRVMDEVIAGLIAARQPFALMHIDLDWFKQVNDTYGHAAGDHVLTVVAAALRSATRAGDTIARIGGDEFVVILPGVVHDALVLRIAQRIIDTLAQPIAFEGNTCRISASIGFVLSSRYENPEADRMLSDADRALYDSKHAGRGRASMG